jgi:Ca-activated chloride channel family protein
MAALATLLLVQGAPAKAAKKTSKVPKVSKLLAQTDEKLGDGQVAVPSSPQNEGEDRTLCPYFHVPDGDPGTDRLPLKETGATVEIAGVVANVGIRQVFANDGSEPLEAIYVFPASTRAAVHGVRMKIGERTIVAKIKKRAEAKKTYEKAKAQGKKASLLDQERPNVFTMRVANIMPGDTIEVSIDYSELLDSEGGTYSFVYPAVVGPRYGPGADPARDEWIESPYQHEGEKETYSFDIDVELRTGLPLKDIRSPSHAISVEYPTARSARVSLDEKEADRDFVLEYRLAGEAIESDVLLYEHGDERFFLLMMQPPRSPAPSETLPREFIFLVDVSGSMSGFPLKTAKTLMANLLDDLEPTDHFNIVTFAGSSWSMSETSLPCTDANIEAGFQQLEGFHGGGGTELMAGLERAYGVPRLEGERISRSVVVITDGYVGVEAKAYKYIRDRLSEANLFAFGIGSSVNRYLIEAMARAGSGEPFVVLSADKAPAEAQRFRRYVRTPVLTDIEVEYDGFKAFDHAPLRIPDLLAERPLVVYGKYKGKPKGRIRVKGLTSSGTLSRTIELADREPDEANAPIRHLWARRWIQILTDQLSMLPGNGGIKKGITSLGMHYSLLSAFTSFVAVDKHKAQKTGKLKTVKQPLPLPAGVSDLAVGDPSNAMGALMGSAVGQNFGFGGLGLKGTGSGGGGTGEGTIGLGSLGTIGKAAVSGSLSKEAIRKKIRTAVKACPAVQSALKSCPCLEIKIKLKITIGADGKVVSVKVVSQDVPKGCGCGEALAAPIVKSVRKSLEKTDFGTTTKTVVVYPLVIKS